MCSLTFAIGAASAVFQHMGQRSAARQANQQNQQLEALRRQQVERDYVIQRDSMAANLEERVAAGADEKAQAAREALILRGRVRVAQGESGSGTGMTTQTLLRDADFQGGIQIGRIDANTRAAERAHALEMRGLDNRRVTSMENAYANTLVNHQSGPSPLGLVGGILGGATADDVGLITGSRKTTRSVAGRGSGIGQGTGPI